jgi:hypothetical protein
MGAGLLEHATSGGEGRRVVGRLEYERWSMGCDCWM